MSGYDTEFIYGCVKTSLFMLLSVREAQIRLFREISTLGRVDASSLLKCDKDVFISIFTYLSVFMRSHRMLSSLANICDS